ncbi:hypothetical protein BBJ28_00017524 [Nothophytophthora sp. Chile5]|nr:hypothetical protein BBJ28_00017524 [Nothophytophthora sp. Chile5]
MTKPAAPSAASSPLVELSLEILELVERLLDVEALLTLSATSRVLHDGLRALTEARCKRECFTTYLYPTIASYRMEAAVPRTWMQLYLAFSTLRGLRWSVCRSEGTSSSLRTLKSDTQEYESDPTTTFLLRYVAHDLETGDEEGQMSVRRVVIFGGQSEGIPFEPFDDLYLLCVENTDANCTRKSLAAWVPLNVTGQAPSPRCGHDATLLSPKLLMISGGSSGVTPIPTLDIFFLHIEGCAGQDEATGQLENDVYVLDIAHQRWRHLDVPGDAPCPRRGFKNQFFGTSLVVSSGFVRSTQAGKVDHQLPDSDVHVLSLV